MLKDGTSQNEESHNKDVKTYLFHGVIVRIRSRFKLGLYSTIPMAEREIRLPKPHWFRYREYIVPEPKKTSSCSHKTYDAAHYD